MARLGELLSKATQLLHKRQLLTDNREGYRQSQSSGVRRVALDFFQSRVGEKQSRVGHGRPEGTGPGRLVAVLVGGSYTTMRAAAMT